ncbi:TonB-dependent receptor [Roseateles oligotrophus]|uniref:TonB-dependent receptor n=1 Tax=Roseateles oligotrophus TaxID=1769250 RepID=A0ABT2YDN3_9BURK|nr:TonB-dependent receptor [Roseateles oligotrophus]MCV2368159.1 TonB-dependent receptor [Roseateles oligotrophus]
MKVKLSPIAAAVTMTLLSVTLAAQAQQAETKPAAKQDSTQLEQVVVTGIRSARESSINAKRNGEGIMEVITAEDVGKMPDKNVADSLQRLPGVNTITAGGNEGGFGENDRVSMRGTPPSLTNTLINGHVVGTGDWFILNQAASGRSVSYSLLPSQMIDRVEVSKTSRADTVEGGVAGSVDIKTRSPLNAKKQFEALASIGGVYSTLSEKYDPQLSAAINWKNEAKTIGVMAQVFSEKRTIRRDGQEFFWHGSIDSLWGHNDLAIAAHPELKGQVMSLMTGAALFEQERKREGGLLTVQFRPTAGVDLELSGFTSKLKADNINRNFITTLHKPIVNSPSGVIPTGITAGGGNISAITIPAATTCDAGATCAPSATDTIYRPGASSESQYLNFDGKFKISDAFSVSTKLGTTTGKGLTPKDIGMEIWAQPASVDYKSSGSGNPVVVKVANSGKWTVGPDGDAGLVQLDPWGSNTTSKDTEHYGQADGMLNLGEGMFERLKFGARYTEHTRELTQYGLNTAAAGRVPGTLPWGGQLYPSNYGSGLGLPSIDYAQMDKGTLAAWSAKYQTPGALLNDSYYKVKEPVSAAYVMTDMVFGNVTANMGLRAVHSKTDVTRNLLQADKTTYAASTVSNTNTEYLPSASVRADLGRDIVLRSSLARTMSRPDFGQLGSLSLDNLTHTGTGGNPNLKPILSNNFDVGAEWYFAPKAMVSAALFHMDLKSYVSLGTFKGTFLNTQTGKLEEYTLTAAKNTTASVNGIELNIDMPIGAGFGFNSNYTYADGKETSDGCKAEQAKGKDQACDMLGNSKNSFNIGGYYEAYGFNARVAYNRRSAFLNGLSRADAIYQDTSGTWMASLGYDFTPNLALTFDAKDINKPILKSYKYDGANNKQPQSFYDNGAQYYLTLRAKY